MWRDLERICSALGLPFRHPSQFPRSGLLAARVACASQHESWLPEFVRRTYLANFAEDRDISDPSVIGSILEAVGQPAEQITAASSAGAKTKLRAQSEQAVALGIFGAPTCVVGEEIFWGNDRLETAVAWAAQTGRAR
jgi:2-hydroxychromene-2-carboxylate isomerase